MNNTSCTCKWDCTVMLAFYFPLRAKTYTFGFFEYRKISERRGAKFVPIWMPISVGRLLRQNPRKYCHLKTQASWLYHIQSICFCFFPGVLWLWHLLYSLGPHSVSGLNLYIFVVSRAFMAGAAGQAGDANSSRVPGLNSGLQGSLNVYRDDLLLLPHWQRISSFVFYIDIRLLLHKKAICPSFCKGRGHKYFRLHMYFLASNN